MEIITYIHRVQALDKAIAYVAQAFSEINKTNHIVVLEMERTQNLIPSCKVLFELMASVTNQAIIIGKNEIHEEAISVFNCFNVPILYINESLHDLSVIDMHINKRVNLFIQWSGVKSKVSKYIYKSVLRKKGRVLRFFKSLHDKGLGLTAMPINESIITMFRKRLSHLHLKIKNAGVEDYYLLHGQEFIRSMQGSHVSSYKYKVITYPLGLPAWKKMITNYHNDSASASTVIGVFIRGEIRKRSPNEQIMPNWLLKKQLDDVFEITKKVFSDIKVVIKPHPNQDVEELKKIIGHGDSFYISYDPPAVIASKSKFIIGMSTSAILDGLLLGKPAINYYNETDALRLLHPKGSVLNIMGIKSVSTKKELEEAINSIINDKYDYPDLIPYIGNQSRIRELLIEQSN